MITIVITTTFIAPVIAAILNFDFKVIITNSTSLLAPSVANSGSHLERGARSTRTVLQLEVSISPIDVELVGEALLLIGHGHLLVVVELHNLGGPDLSFKSQPRKLRITL